MQSNPPINPLSNEHVEEIEELKGRLSEYEDIIGQLEQEKSIAFAEIDEMKYIH